VATEQFKFDNCVDVRLLDLVSRNLVNLLACATLSYCYFVASAFARITAAPEASES